MLNWINKKMKKRKGFTLVELVVVIAILGILATIAVPKFKNVTANATKTAHEANIRVLKSAANVAIADGIENATWIKTDGTEDNKWSDYLDDWPELPEGLKDQTFTNGYKVTITDGVVKVVNADSSSD